MPKRTKEIITFVAMLSLFCCIVLPSCSDNENNLKPEHFNLPPRIKGRILQKYVDNEDYVIVVLQDTTYKRYAIHDKYLFYHYRKSNRVDLILQQQGFYREE